VKRCTRLFGHNWSKWTTNRSKPEDVKGTQMCQIIQQRKCDICGYYMSEWLNEWIMPLPEPPKEQDDD